MIHRITGFYYSGVDRFKLNLLWGMDNPPNHINNHIEPAGQQVSLLKSTQVC